MTNKSERKSYRFNPETVRLIAQLAKHLKLKMTEVIERAVRELAKREGIE